MTSPHNPREFETEPMPDPGPDTRSADDVFDQTQLPPAPAPGDDLAADHMLPPVHEDDDLILGGSVDDRSGDQSGRSEQAKQEAGKVAEDAKQGGQQVAQTAKEEVGHVVSTVGDQARGLLDQTRSELGSQVGTQQQKVTEGIRTLGDDLKSIADGSPQEGMALDLARQASERTQAVASWLEGREPADLLSEVQQFARRRPGAFIAIAAGIGLLAGRFTRGLAQDSSSSSSPSYSPSTDTSSYGVGGTQGYAASQDVTGGHGLAGGTTGVGSAYAGTDSPAAGYAAPTAPMPGADPYDEIIADDDVPQDDPFLPGDTGPGQR